MRGFLGFRVGFNTRFYYPVFALLFLDFGLTLEQFALLNLLWSAAIVLLEVPSGALADIIGRRSLVILAAVLMVVEMGVILVAPDDAPAVVLALFALNRILSGAAEAMASGADEALTYDALTADGLEDQWPRVLERLTVLQSGAFFTAMLIGAAAYDPNFLNHLFGWHLTKTQTLRLPVWLTLGSSLVALAAALSLPGEATRKECPEHPYRQAFAQVGGVARWLFSQQSVLTIIGAVILLDHVVRLPMTLAAKYYRGIGYDDAWLGVLGAVLAGMGAAAGKPSRWLAERASRTTVFMALSGLTLAGLLGLALAIPYWGVAFMGILAISIQSANFFASYYLNRAVDSQRRATLLSFKGLASNLAFGGINLVYTAMLRGLGGGEDLFLRSLWGLPIYFGAVWLIFVLWVNARPSQPKPSPEPPAD
ncbi:MAG: MFS transporter [Candidatus Eremiobacteraeota bacterium]|nr:MFS transporter [Candidatus Eremiobacteraeota bacterium]